MQYVLYFLIAIGATTVGSLTGMGGGVIIKPLMDVLHGFDVQTINGHCFDELEAAFAHARTVKGKPSVIITKTTKGKGVSYMENQVSWHGTAPNKEQYDVAMQELTAALQELEGC